MGNLEEDEKVKLVGDYSVSRESDEVEVPKSNLQRTVRLGDGSRAPVTTGGLGYWIGDLGMRANLSVANQSGTGENFAELLHAQDSSSRTLS